MEKIDYDLVFVVGNGSKYNNVELRIALRSVAKFVPHRKIFLVGAKPNWIDYNLVTHIPADDPYTDGLKDRNIWHKIMLAVADERVSERFLFCSDDQFVTRMSVWGDFAPRWIREFTPEHEWFLKKAAERKWHKWLRDTLLRFPNSKYWEPHIWMPFTKEMLRAASEYAGWETRNDCTFPQCVYNYIEQPNARKAEDHQMWGRRGEFSGKRHCGYFDGTLTNNEYFWKYVGKTFGDKCRYEIDARDEKYIAVLRDSIETAKSKNEQSMLEVALAQAQLDDAVRIDVPVGLEVAAEQGAKQQSCGCQKKAAHVGPLPQEENVVSNKGLACDECLNKHLSKAAVLLAEYQTNQEYKLEFKLCVGNLACAEDHALALGQAKRAEAIRKLRKEIVLNPLNININEILLQ
jgi:hypothetical protein